jgi:hypothetical protein
MNILTSKIRGYELTNLGILYFRFLEEYENWPYKLNFYVISQKGSLHSWLVLAGSVPG